jgi:DNA processing protein
MMGALFRARLPCRSRLESQVDGTSVPYERLRRWLLIGLVTAANPTRRKEYFAAYGSLERAADVSEKEWARFGLLRPSGANDIFGAVPRGTARGSAQDALDPDGWVGRELEKAARIGARILCMEDAGYPPLLRSITDPPPIIYVRGVADLTSQPAVAVVGARRASRYGLSAAGNLAGGLAGYGVAVVSGGARGVDSAAHRGALQAGGTTLAVMGAGLDVPYPEENEELFETIAATGAVLSEFPFGSAPEPYHFPIRNRIIAGMSLGVVVVEGTEISGSMITATLAAEYGREVFAVPGPITSPLTEAPHKLILEGAKLVRRAADIIEELPADAIAARPEMTTDARPGRAGEDPEDDAAGLNESQRVLLGALDAHGGSTADELASELRMPTGELLGALVELELRGLVDQLPGGRFARRA